LEAVVDYGSFRREVLNVLGGAAASEPHRPEDDLAAFAFVSEVFVPPFRQLLEDAAASDDARHNELQRLGDLLEQVMRYGDDETVDALAMRVIYSILCLNPGLLAAAHGVLGRATLEAVQKFQAFLVKADTFRDSVGR
jgi:hypothetical protein